MQPYDIFMILVLATATLYGLWKGMAWQVASVSSLIVSYLAALRFSPQLAPYLSAREPWNRFLAMLILYLVVGGTIWILFHLVSGVIERVKLKEFDRQVGGIFGAFKGVVLCVAITFFAVSLSEKGRGLVLESRSGYYIARLLSEADPIMPPELHDVLHPYLHRLEEELQSAPARSS